MDLAADMMARPDARAAHEAALSDLMIAVIERFTPWRSFPASIRELNARRGDWRIRRRCRLDARRRPEVTPSIDTLAKEAGLSRAHFFRLFESSIGVPPKVYLNVVRMEQAVDAVLNQSATSVRYQRSSSALPSRRISRASSATMPASARASSGMSPVSRADAAPHMRENETGW